MDYAPQNDRSKQDKVDKLLIRRQVEIGTLNQLDPKYPNKVMEIKKRYSDMVNEILGS